MSQFGFARDATKAFLKTFNARNASRLVTGGFRAGGRGYVSSMAKEFGGGAWGMAGAIGMTGNPRIFARTMGAGVTGGARGFKRWAWPTKGAGLVGKRAARIGTMGAGVGGAAMLASQMTLDRDRGYIG